MTFIVLFFSGLMLGFLLMALIMDGLRAGAWIAIAIPSTFLMLTVAIMCRCLIAIHMMREDTLGAILDAWYKHIPTIPFPIA